MLKTSKNLKITVLVMLAAIVLSFCFYVPAIFQEGNPASLFKAIIKLNGGPQNIVKIDSVEEKYLTKSENGKESILNKLDERGYQLIDQLGSGYLFRNKDLDTLTITHRYYSRFYSIWLVGEPKNIRDSIGWAEYRSDEYDFSFNYPLMSINNKWWGNLSEKKSFLNLLLPNQVLSKDNNFYLAQKYNVDMDWQTGELTKTENTFIPCEKNDHSYPWPWHIVISDVKNESDLDSAIKQKLGVGCSYKEKIATDFYGNYQIKIDGDGKDLDKTLCPVNYDNHIVYSPVAKKVAFWSTGQECQIGLGFMSNNCFDEKISNSFHFFD